MTDPVVWLACCVCPVKAAAGRSAAAHWVGCSLTLSITHALIHHLAAPAAAATSASGVMFNPNSSSPSGLGAPGSPRSLFSSHSPNPFSGLNGTGGMRSVTGSMQLQSSFVNANAGANVAAAADAAAAAAAYSAALGVNQLPPFYYQAAAAAASSAGAAAANNLTLQAALSQGLMNQHTASLAAVQQQQMQQQLLQASLSAALSQANPYLQGYPSTVLSSALEPMRSAGGSLSLDGGLQQQASVAAAAAAALLQQQQQQHHAAAQLRRNLSTPAAVAAQLQLNSAAAAASAQLGLPHASALSSSASLSPLTAQMGRLHVTHSADLSHLDAAQLLGGSAAMGQMAARSKFKARKNSEPKIGPDGQPRLNARQRRTLRRAKERALKGLLEVSQALLQKAEVQVTVPNISHLTALEELAAVEAEKELAAGEGNDSCLSPSGSLTAGSKGVNGSNKTRSQQLAAAAAAVEESVCEIARAAVAAVTAQATGKDTSSAAQAAQAAAAQAASAAASAGAVLPPNFKMPEQEEPNSEDLPGCEPLECLSHSAPTSPVGSTITVSDPSSGRSSSSSSSGSLPSSGRCSSSGSAASSFAAQGAASKPPAGQPFKAAGSAAAPPALSTATSGSPLCSPSPSPTPAGAAAAKAGVGSQLEGIDIAGLIGQLSLKKDEGMVDDKLIRDLQIIQSLIGALKAPNASAGLDMAGSTSLSPLPGVGADRGGPRGGGSAGGAKVMVPKRAHSYTPGAF